MYIKTITMDKKDTIPVGGTFYPYVMELFESKQKVGILYEDSGVTRANGLIESVSSGTACNG
ncbi:hypothetical protein [Chitinophaga pinensis]|uniref:Uncharacterized protein n=1 Tax=Chitinophaga pinensis TaxID=79329 RepID=A0A5C6LTD1_9BACT|nr:hypothetical protein [Chitinophaga pinensis]TWV99943.1 hypothetical protein FEF09_13175 [Chitinophaga pinensis]